MQRLLIIPVTISCDFDPSKIPSGKSLNIQFRNQIFARDGTGSGKPGRARLNRFRTFPSSLLSYFNRRDVASQACGSKGAFLAVRMMSWPCTNLLRTSQNIIRAGKRSAGLRLRGLATASEPYDVVVIGGGKPSSYCVHEMSH